MPKTVQELFKSLIPKLGGSVDIQGNCYGITCALDHYILHNGLSRFMDALKLISDRLKRNPDNFYLEIQSALERQEQMVASSGEEKILLDIADICERISYYQKEAKDNFARGTRPIFPGDVPNAQTDIRGFSRVCERAELAALFSRLKKLIQGCAYPIGINIGDDAHVMVIRYNSELGGWSFFDPNSIVGKWIDRTNGFSSHKLSKLVKLALESPKNCPFVATIITIVYLSKDCDELERNVVNPFRMDTVGTGAMADMWKKAWCESTKAPLFLTAITGEIGEFRVWLAHGIDPSASQDADGCTCLHFASYYNNFEIVKALLEADVNPNATNVRGNTALHTASGNDHSGIARLLIAAGADINCQDSAGNAALHLSAENGCLRVVSDLIAAKANLNLVNSKHYTALQLAAQNNCVETTHALVSARADVNLKNLRGDTALHIAVRYNNPEIVRVLVHSVVLDPNLLNLDGEAALHAAVSCDVKASYAESPQLVEALIKSRKLNPNIKNSQGDTALHIAARFINLQAVQALLEDGRVDPNLRNNQNVTPLQIAIVQGDRELVERFLKFSRVDVAVRTTDGKNLYELAQESGKTEITELLLQDQRTQALASVPNLTPGARR